MTMQPVNLDNLIGPGTQDEPKDIVSVGWSATTLVRVNYSDVFPRLQPKPLSTHKDPNPSEDLTLARKRIAEQQFQTK